MPLNSVLTAPTGGNVTATAVATAGEVQAAILVTIAHQLSMNQKVAMIYAGSISTVIVLFTVFHWSRFFYSRYASRVIKNAGIVRLHVSAARSVRHVLTHRLPGFISIGHAVLVIAYIAINLTLTLTNVEVNSLIAIAKRLGWMAVVNAAFITFLALKNTPLAFLTAYSYDRLNVLHQVGGYTTVAYALLHTITVCKGFTEIHSAAILLEHPQIAAIVAVSAMFIMMASAILIRRIQYELFYLIHISMFMLFIITVAMHQPHFHQGIIIVTILLASMWGADRILRACRILWYSYDNHATVTPLPNGGTRIVLSRCPSRAVPGTHCFLWVPRIRAIETHPFTIVNTSPKSLELVVAAYDGFTNDLHNYALKNPGTVLRASVDGPYGAIPNFSRTADKIVLIAGGSGASFTFGVALDVLRNIKPSSNTSIAFIWAVKEQETLTWFTSELAKLQASPRVTVQLYCTQPSSNTQTPPSARSSSTFPTANEKQHPSSSTKAVSTSPPSMKNESMPHTSAILPTDIEKQFQYTDPTITTSKPPSTKYESISPLPATNINAGRPNVDTIIRHVVARADVDERIAIAACGPDRLMWNIRRAATNCIQVNGPSIELHCEQFGW